MLTEVQKKYLAKIPADAVAKVAPWDKGAAQFAETLIEQIKKVSGLEVFWGGSLALGILGENDIDLSIFSEPGEFPNSLPRVISVLGEPTYRLEEKVLWRIIKDGHKIDASLISRNSETVLHDILFNQSLKEDRDLLQEYVCLKTPELSAREYYRVKNEFYNRIVNKNTNV